MQSVFQCIFQDGVCPFFGAMAGAYIFQILFFQLLGDFADFRIRFIKKMESADVSVDLLLGEGLADLFDDIDDPAMGTGIDDQQAFVCIQHETLFMRKIIDDPSFFCLAIHAFPFADGR